MANLTELSQWEAGIYQLETTDPVEAGSGGVSNEQARLLGNRTRWLKDNIWRTGDVKEVDCTNIYLNANFDETGLGINKRIGWAICNGANGTRDRRGRVSVGYDATNYPILGAPGGSKDAVVVEHSHKIGDQSGSSGSGTTNTRYIGKEIESNLLGIPYTDNTGVSGTDKNMQPYIVSLFIQKL